MVLMAFFFFGLCFKIFLFLFQPDCFHHISSYFQNMNQLYCKQKKLLYSTFPTSHSEKKSSARFHKSSSSPELKISVSGLCAVELFFMETSLFVYCAWVFLSVIEPSIAARPRQLTLRLSPTITSLHCSRRDWRRKVESCDCGKQVAVNQRLWVWFAGHWPEDRLKLLLFHSCVSKNFASGKS